MLKQVINNNSALKAILDKYKLEKIKKKDRLHNNGLHIDLNQNRTEKIDDLRKNLPSQRLLRKRLRTNQS